MEKIAIVNANSFGRYYQKSIDDLEEKFFVKRFVYDRGVDSSILIK